MVRSVEGRRRHRDDALAFRSFSKVVIADRAVVPLAAKAAALESAVQSRMGTDHYAQLLDQLLVAVNEPLSSFDLSLGWETLATLADELKSSRILFACFFAWPCFLIATEGSFRSLGGCETLRL